MVGIIALIHSNLSQIRGKCKGVVAKMPWGERNGQITWYHVYMRDIIIYENRTLQKIKAMGGDSLYP